MNLSQEAHLRWLRKQLTDAQNDAWSREPTPNAKNELEKCRKELRDFTTKLRQAGVKI